MWDGPDGKFIVILEELLFYLKKLGRDNLSNKLVLLL